MITVSKISSSSGSLRGISASLKGNIEMKLFFLWGQFRNTPPTHTHTFGIFSLLRTTGKFTYFFHQKIYVFFPCSQKPKSETTKQKANGKNKQKKKVRESKRKKIRIGNNLPQKHLNPHH